MRSVSWVLLLVACSLPDDDADGWPATVDCDDADAAVGPTAAEVCNGVDDDCDGLVDQGAADAGVWFADTDGDGFGSATALVVACDAPAGFVADGTDCDDGRAAAFPGADEACDGLDDDCDGLADEDAPTVTFYVDADGDGHGDGLRPVEACAAPPGTAAVGDDCDDLDPAVLPGAAERCDGVDEDCDGTPDDDPTDAVTLWDDVDGDGWGTGDADDSNAEGCAGTPDTATRPGDCDDLDAAIHPEVDERCDGVDEDCDGAVDDLPLDPTEWHADADGDGYGSVGIATIACEAPPDGVTDGTDCDDFDAADHPGGVEVCDEQDNDCDALVDEGFGGGCGVVEPIATVSASDAAATYSSSVASTTLDRDVRLVGDLDGDGFDDLAVGTPRTPGTAAAYEGGRATLFYGEASPSGDHPTAGQPALTGSAGNFVGSRVSGAGDLDGDGYGDLLVGADGADVPFTDGGASYLLYGGPRLAGSVAIGAVADAKVNPVLFGQRVGSGAASLGDLDGDGYDDAAVGALAGNDPTWGTGSVYLLYGGPARLSGDLDVDTLPALDGDPDREWLGKNRSIGSVDLDGDGALDLLLGTDSADVSEVYVLYGDGARVAAGGWQASVLADAIIAGTPGIDTDPSEHFGGAVAAVPDSDGDGLDDVAIAGWELDGAAPRSGAVLVFSGSSARLAGALDASAASGTLQGTSYYEFFGRDVAAADLDGDGLGDLAVGAPYGDSPGTDAGEVSLFLGGTLTGTFLASEAARHIEGTVGAEQLGWSMSIGDLDGDGSPDLLLDAAGFGGLRGRAYWFPAGDLF